MSTKSVQPGDTLKLTAPSGGVTTGVPVKIGRLFVVPQVTAAVGEKFSGDIEGVHTIPKVSSEIWIEGTVAYYNTGSALATSTSTTAMLIGLCVEAAASGSTTAKIKLTPGAGAWLNQ